MEKNLKPAPVPTRDSRGKTQDINNVSGHFGGVCVTFRA